MFENSLTAESAFGATIKPATSDYIVNDTGNCSPPYMRCTINQIPCTVDLVNTSGMQLSLLVQPLALPHLSEEPVQDLRMGLHEITIATWDQMVGAGMLMKGLNCAEELLNLSPQKNIWCVNPCQLSTSSLLMCP